MNHELCPKFFKDEFQELDAIATQSVLVHNHNFLDASFADFPYQGAKALAVIVEAGSDVGDDAMVGIDELEVGNLSFKVTLLCVTADSGVGDALFRPFDVVGVLVDALASFPAVVAHELGDALGVIEALASGGAERLDFSAFVPALQSFCAHCISLSDELRGLKLTL